MKRAAAYRFCDRWLPAWTGNAPKQLMSFYDDTAYYRDPSRPNGMSGRDAIRRHFRALLRLNPTWTWTAREVFPTVAGFILKWTATMLSDGDSVTFEGLDIVEVRHGKITRNEVYFDRLSMGISTPQRRKR